MRELIVDKRSKVIVLLLTQKKLSTGKGKIVENKRIQVAKIDSSSILFGRFVRYLKALVLNPGCSHQGARKNF